jgi:hypothetical protein
MIFAIFVILSGCSIGKRSQIVRSNDSNTPAIADGIAAFEKGDLEKSRDIFNTIIENRRESSAIQEAQWYLARIADKQNKLDEARLQYMYFIQNFPSSKHVPEAKKRLSVLSKATTLPDLPEKEPVKPESQERMMPVSRKTPRYGSLTGALTTEYLYDLQTSPAPETVVQNRLSEYLDLRWIKSAGGDLKIYLSTLYSHDYVIPNNDQHRLSKLFAEWNDPRAIVDLRLGRQTASGNTLFSRYDGFAVGIRPTNSFALNAGAGYPVSTIDQNHVQIQNDRLFYETYISLYDFYHLGGRIYYTQEYDNGFSTRRAVGLNTYWLNESLNISTVVDYDLDFRKFNDELLGVDFRYLKFQWSIAAEYRKNPFLDMETALNDPALSVVNPPVTTLDVLRETLSREEIQTLALDNTTDSLDFRLGTIIDFTPVWRGDFRFSHMTSRVLEFPTGKADKVADRYSAFISERNGLNWSETWTLLFLYQPATDYQSLTGVTTFSKFWGISTQGTLSFRWEQLEYKTFSNRSTRLVPGFLFSYSFRNGISAALEADYSIDKNNTAVDTINTIRTRTTLTIPF